MTKNIVNEKTKQLKWQSWFKGLVAGLAMGGVLGAFIEAVNIYQIIK